MCYVVLYYIISMKIVLHIVVAPGIKFRFKLRAGQPNTINAIIDKVYQYCIK